MVTGCREETMFSVLWMETSKRPWQWVLYLLSSMLVEKNKACLGGILLAKMLLSSAALCFLDKRRLGQGRVETSEERRFRAVLRGGGRGRDQLYSPWRRREEQDREDEIFWRILFVELSEEGVGSLLTISISESEADKLPSLRGREGGREVGTGYGV